MNIKNLKKKLIGATLIFICAAIVLEVNVLEYANSRQVSRTLGIMLDQIERNLSENEERENATLEALKLEYIERANSVSYILAHEEEAIDDVDELKKIASMVYVDEIHIFDENGVIVSGTNPEYFGLTFDSGEQMSYFKPMLGDKNLTMCQDVTPNTAEAKSMMYAITWDNTKTYMVQVGVEPVRLLEEMKNNDISEVINRIPVYDGMDIYVADLTTSEIAGATDADSVGANMYSLGILNEKDNYKVFTDKTVRLNGYKTYCYYRQHGDYLIIVTHSTRANQEGFLVSIIIEVLGLFVASAIILVILLKLLNANQKVHDQMSIVSSIADIYYSMHLIDMAGYSIEKLESNELMDRVVDEGNNALDMLNRIVRATIEDEYKESALAFVDLTTLGERLKDRQTIFIDAVDKNVGWLRISFITVEADEDGVPTKVIVTTQIIEEDKKREEELEIKANRDELTGLFNRRAYEDDMLNYPSVPPEADFIYAAIDINGLKVVNDELGHMAGDELIEGAAECFKRTFGNYGKVYRTGGDEFVAMFFADEERQQAILKDLEQMTAEWEGVLAKDLSVSVGCATKREFNVETVVDMAKIADQRMYQAKAEHYARKGIDRRGQAAAHKALCNIYTKILKINLTDDTFSIVNMDMSEQTSDKGYSDKISEWLSGFGKTGQVHNDDLEQYLEQTNIEYLREYFKQDKTSISIFYRRKYEDSFKQVLMEMIPADDYSNDNQSLFLYVKSIDK